MRFTDRVALITAAASGIGRATADIIGAEGGIVVAVDTDKTRLDATVEALKSAGGRAHGRQADALDPDQVGGAVESVVRELGPFGINVNAIAPSLTLTERLQPRWDKWTAEERARETDRMPLRRVAVARDQARVICFLASQDADFVTGVTIDVTGGL